MTNKKVAVIGGGVAGLSAALELAEFGVAVAVVEQSAFAGGHAVQYACKATDQCVKCGACMVEEKLALAGEHAGIELRTGTRVQEVVRSDRFALTLESDPAFIDPEKCTGCGKCYAACPEEGAVLKGYSRHHTPFYAVSLERCRHLQGRSCSACRDACPEAAIDLDAGATTASLLADAVVMATGFAAFDPRGKPYGYGVFDDVVTNLEMERMLRRHGLSRRPSNGDQAKRMAFIQCVGSRDAKLGHLWCSRVCCGSAVRMAGLVKARQPESEITFFYMDIQTFGRDFDTFLSGIKQDVRMIRAIPGDIYPVENDGLRITYFDNDASETIQEDFDLVVLSVGMIPGPDTEDLGKMLGAAISETGFAEASGPESPAAGTGVFTAGAVIGPMSISQAAAGAGKAAWEVLKYLGRSAP